MFRIEEIQSLDDPRLAPYRNMRQQADHAGEQIFVAEGANVVRRLFESGFPVVSVVFPPKWLTEFEPLLMSRAEEIPVFIAEKEVLEGLTGFALYQGVLAISKIPRPATVSEILQVTSHPRFLVALDGLSGPENIGALVRTSAAFGVQGLIMGETCPTPYLRRSVRSSMGAIFKMPYVQASHLDATLAELRKLGIRTIAAHPHTSRTIFDVDLTGDTCVLFGSEGHGISPALLNECDDVVAIPMQSQVDSLNVSNAAAVFLYEVTRQRHLFPSRPSHLK